MVDCDQSGDTSDQLCRAPAGLPALDEKLRTRGSRSQRETEPASGWKQSSRWSPALPEPRPHIDEPRLRQHALVSNIDDVRGPTERVEARDDMPSTEPPKRERDTVPVPGGAR